MNHVRYFKLQAKNLLRDYKTQTSHFDESIGTNIYKYSPTFFDIEGIFLDYDESEDNFTLMKAQHLIALMIGFDKWSDFLKASEPELELRRLLFENQHKICHEEWNMYMINNEIQNGMEFDAEDRLVIFKHVFLNVEGHSSSFGDYRLSPPK